MNNRRLLLILGLVVAVPAFGRQTNQNKIGAGSEPADVQSGNKERAMYFLSDQKYRAEQDRFEKLLERNKSAENYAGLAESLAMQNRIHEAEVVLREARANNFANDPSVAAVSGYVSYLHASAVSYTKYELYMEASETLCKRALAVDPQNRMALATLEKVRAKRFEKAKEFEKNGDLVLAQFEYEELLKEKNDDVDANSALVKLLRLRRERYK